MNRKLKAENSKKISFKRAGSFLFVVIIIFILLIVKIAYIQFVQGTYYKTKANNQSTASKIITSKRGTIFDKTNKALAISADVDTISVNPDYIRVMKGNDKDEEKTEKLKQDMSKAFADIFQLDKDDVYNKLTSNNSVETIVSKVEQTKVDKLKEWLDDNKVATGVNIDKDTKRYYPYDNLASNVLGFCGTNNNGLDGIELSYDSILKGTSGRLTTSVSVSKDVIPDSDEEYVKPENGKNIYLTIDSNIQAIAEKYLKQAVEENKCKRGGNVIIMDPSTGDILAMATYPDYNLNDPYTPNETISSGWDELSQKEQTNRLYSMWRNRAVLDTYEPGSTFKVITASIALEENLVETDTVGDFYCKGYQQVNDKQIKCTSTSGHGSQSLRLAMENSCNPAFIQLGQRIGSSTFYKYLNAFGFFNKTGIDLPSEGESTFWTQKNCGPVELATMSFGQRFTITPMQLVRAASTIANDGILMTPHVVDKIENVDTGTITEVEKEEGKQVISKETAEKMRDMMQSVVDEGGGNYAKISGYEIGGKTGTSEPDPNHPENGYVASFLAIAPTENTKITCLLTLYSPQVSNYYGGHIAAPVVSQILSEVLPYMDVPSSNQETSNNKDLISVPSLKNKTVDEAKKIIEKAGLKYATKGTSDEIITSQNPISGASLFKNGIIELYTSEHSEKSKTIVPDLKGSTLEQAKVMLESKNLNIASSGSGIVISQDITAGKEEDEGTIINVKLQSKIGTSQH